MTPASHDQSIDTGHLCPAAPAVAHGGPVPASSRGKLKRIGVVLQAECEMEPALRRAAAEAGGACVVMTVIGVPPDLGRLEFWAPLSGLVTYHAIRLESERTAARLACRTALAAPGHVAVDHRACDGWRSPGLLAALRAGCFDCVVFGAGPRHRRDRRAVMRAARAGGTAIVVAAAPAPGPAWHGLSLLRDAARRVRRSLVDALTLEPELR
jgi:hypothetical protein